MGILEKSHLLPLVAVLTAGLLGIGADFFGGQSVDFFGHKPRTHTTAIAPESVLKKGEAQESHPVSEVSEAIERARKGLEESLAWPDQDHAQPGPCATCTGNADTDMLYYFFTPDCQYCERTTMAVDKFYRTNEGRVRVEGVLVTDPGRAIQYYRRKFADTADAPGYPISVSYQRARDMGIKVVPAFILQAGGHTCRATGWIDLERFYYDCRTRATEGSHGQE